MKKVDFFVGDPASPKGFRSPQFFITVLLFLMTSFVLFKLFNPDQTFSAGVKDVLMYLLGSLNTAFLTSVYFWLGSSHGSKTKQDKYFNNGG